MNITELSLLTIAVAAMAAVFWLRRPRISVDAARAAIRAGEAVLIDVREPAEWAGGTAEGAALLPLSDLRGDRRSWQAFLGRNRQRRLFLYCQSGARSAFAASQLRREGYDAVNVGGIGRWRRG